MLITSMLLLFILTFLIYKWINYAKYKKMINAFPGKNGHPIFGDAYYFTSESDKIFTMLRGYTKLFPNSYRIWSIAGFGSICINTPEHAEILLSNPKYIQKSLMYKFMQPWLKTGLLTSGGKKWFQRRKLLTPAFHFNILQRLVEPFAEHNNYLIEELSKECHKDKINIEPIISLMALNLICETSMGIKLDPNDKNQIEYRNAIHGYHSIIQSRLITAWYYFDIIFQFAPLYQYQKKLVKILHQFTKKIITQKEAIFQEDEFHESDTYSKKRLEMLDLLLYAKKKHGTIDDEGIREEVDTFTFAGHDTVAMALCFALLALANEPKHQAKITEELDKHFEGSDRPATYQDLHNLPYLEMCIKECLRLYPSVPLISRYVEEEVQLDENLTIPAGCMVHIQIFDILRNKKHFPEPDKFIPERFSPENSKNRHPFAFIPFSAGPRNCIGQKYAMLELKSIVSCILRNFKLEAVDKISDITIGQDMVLRSKYGINIKFVPRTK